MIVARNKTNHNITIDGITIKSKESYSWVELGLETRTRVAIQNAQNVGWIDVFIYPDPIEETGSHDHDHITEEIAFREAVQELVEPEIEVEENKPRRRTKKEE